MSAKTILTRIATAILLLSALGCDGAGWGSATAGPTPPCDFSVSAAALVSDYVDNEVGADEKYKGKRVLVSGKIESISKGWIGGLYVTLKSRHPFRDVQCSFDKSQKDKLAALSSGQRVRILGKGDGLLGNVHLKDCQVID